MAHDHMCLSFSNSNEVLQKNMDTPFTFVNAFLFVFLSSVGGELERLSLSSVSSTLKAFIEGSTLGEFHTRLAMLLSFHCHLLLVPNQPGQGQLSLLQVQAFILWCSYQNQPFIWVSSTQCT